MENQKEGNITALQNETDLSVKMIALDDKLSNIRAITRDNQIIGDQIWERFNQKHKSEHAFYYNEIVEATKELAMYPAW